MKQEIRPVDAVEGRKRRELGLALLSSEEIRSRARGVGGATCDGQGAKDGST